ncbi:MAG: site-2 protease family protein [Candidatus Dormibacteria bacterium]
MTNQTIRLGRIFGLEISCNWTLLLIYLVIAWTMATSVLPVAAGGQSTLAYWVAGLVGAALFYLGLLAHEISHALVARLNGVRVTGITLWLFGGVTQLDGQPASAGREALITVVGPATSLVIGGAGFGLAAALGAIGAPALIASLVAWLAVMNVVLGVFNLIPALPLDGGRLLSSLLWWRTGSRQAGVHGAVRVGQVFASLLIAAGILEAATGAVVTGIWLAFVGWFLLSAGRAEDRQTKVLARLQGVPVSAAMATPLIRLPDWLTVDQLLPAGGGQAPLAVYALQDRTGQPSGFVSLVDLVALAPQARMHHRLSDFALPRSAVPTADIQEDLDSVLRRVGGALERGVLVVDGSELVGILSGSGVARLATQSSVAGWRRPA